LTSENILYCDFDTPLMFVEDPVTNGITYSQSGEITVPSAPGLGASVDENLLEKLPHRLFN
jgi:L-alanine-DL-glutamate epimerase-like enolase superfamily enzyme